MTRLSRRRKKRLMIPNRFCGYESRACWVKARRDNTRSAMRILGQRRVAKEWGRRVRFTKLSKAAWVEWWADTRDFWMGGLQREEVALE